MLKRRHREREQDAEFLGDVRWAGMSRLRAEVEELQEALNVGEPEAVMLEAADVANFAMMLADLENYAIGAGPGRTMNFRVGDRVAYQAYKGAKRELGVVTATRAGYVFVLFDGDGQAKATPISRLEPA